MRVSDFKIGDIVEKPPFWTDWSGPSKSCEFSDDIENAVKFRFKEDAQRVLDGIVKSQFIGGAQYAVRDHQWGFTDELEDGA